MPEATTEQPAEEQMTDEQKQAWAEWEFGARKWAKIQSEENAKAQADREWANLGSKSNEDFRAFVRRTCGFDPNT
jgi:hypothetical protein